jgi:hypothetical protein
LTSREWGHIGRDVELETEYIHRVRSVLREIGCGVLISEYPCLERIAGICHAIDRQRGSGTYQAVLKSFVIAPASRS